MDDRHHVCQYGQVKVLLGLCGSHPKGVFVEVGAVDGYLLSNTYFLEKMLDWTGVVVEPIKAHADSSKHNRWVPTFNGLVYDREGEADFLHINGYSESLSGIEAAYAPSHKERANREIAQHNLKTQTVRLPCKTINGLMEAYNLTRADYLSLDVQSAELRVLRAYDPKKNPIKCISLDLNGCNAEEIEEWFKVNGYIEHWRHQSADEVMYVDPALKWSWE